MLSLAPRRYGSHCRHTTRTWLAARLALIFLFQEPPYQAGKAFGLLLGPLKQVGIHMKMRIDKTPKFGSRSTLFPGAIWIDRPPYIITGRGKIVQAYRFYSIKKCHVIQHHPGNLGRLLGAKVARAMMCNPALSKVATLPDIEHGSMGIKDEIDCSAVRQALALSKGYGR